MGPDEEERLTELHHVGVGGTDGHHLAGDIGHDRIHQFHHLDDAELITR